MHISPFLIKGKAILPQTDLSSTNITGLILAGGRGRRVDGQDKGFLMYEGASLIDRQVEWLMPQVKQFFISANRNIKQYQKFKCPVLKDHNNNFDGPLYGIFKGLENCKTDWMFVQPVDVPHLPKDLIKRLLNNIENKASSNAFYLKTKEQKHYLSLLIHTSHLDNMKNFIMTGNRKVSDFLREIKCLPVDLNLSEDAFKNLNRRDDY